MNIVSDLFTLGNGWSGTLAQTVADFVPRLVIAVVIWVLAWLIAKAIKTGVHIALDKLGVERMAIRAKINQFLSNANYHGGFSEIVADIIFWLLYLFGINIAFEVLGLSVISNLISDLIAYIPNLFVAVLIILVGAMIAKFVKDLTDGAAKTAKFQSAWLGHFAYVIVMLFVIVTALKQAQVDISFLTDNINTIMMGIMLALGLAFGLGGKDKAKEIIDKYIK